MVAWGSRSHGGIIPACVQAQLAVGVTRVYSNVRHWVVVTKDGRFVTWGGYDDEAHSCRDATFESVYDQLVNVIPIYSVNSLYGFAALLSGGRVVTWDCASDVSRYGSVREQLAADVHDGCSIGYKERLER